MEKRKHMMYQQRIDFDAPANAEVQHVAEKTSEPPPLAHQAGKALPLVRPERQLVYGGSNHWEWPDATPLHDHDTITVDRIREDIDGPSHRFLIQRGDRVEAWFGKDDFREGLVVGISHACGEVRVSFREGSQGQWFDKGQIYPAAPSPSECSPSLRDRRAKLSDLIETVNNRYGQGLTTADQVPAHEEPPPVTIHDRVVIIPVGFKEQSSTASQNGTPAEHAASSHPPETHTVTKEEILAFLTEHPNEAFGMNELCQRFMPERKLAGDTYRCHPVWQLLCDLGEAGEAQVIRTAFAEPRFQALPVVRTPNVAPYTFNEFQAFLAEHSKTPVTFERFQTEFMRIWDSQDALKTELVARFKAKPLAILAARFGSWDAKRSTKEKNAENIVSKMLCYFVLDGVISYSMDESYEDAVRTKVLAVTAGEYYRHFEERQAESLAKEQALAHPQNLADFRLLVETQGEDALTEEQLARYDALRADLQRELRASQKTKTTVERFASDELQTITFTRKDGYHEKRECPLYIVQLESRVERDAFNELNRKAKQLGGWYSSFKRSDAGFQFLDASQADRFCTLLSGDVDRTDVLEARKERRELSAAEALHELATSLYARADETIVRSNESLQNTARRADMQAGIRGRAYADQAMSRTLHSLAEALSRGEAKYLDGIRHKTQLETLDTVLHLAKWARVRAVKQMANESNYRHGVRQGRIEEEPIGLATIRFVEFPYPHTYRRHLEEAIQKGRLTKGVKQAAETLKKYLGSQAGEYVEFTREYEVEAYLDFLDRAKAQGVDVEWVSKGCENYKRLVRANITSLPELRAALREYLEHRAERRGDDPVRVAERELIGTDLPGFFPTPRPVIERMLELAQIAEHHRVLEPSCGKGDILDAIREEHPELELYAIERNYTLFDVLAAKGHAVEFTDFLDHAGSYDRIVMNPPFENGQDIEHVQHAYSLLAPGGRLVSVMCEGPFFRSDVKSVAFREWLEHVASETEELPEDAFNTKDAFRQTSVRTRLVTITKGGDDV